MTKIIHSTANPLIKRLASLTEKKYRQREGLFLAEGLRIIAEAVDAGHAPETLLYAPQEGGGPPALARVLAATYDSGGTVIETSADVLARLSGKRNPQVVLAAFPLFPTDLTGLDRHSAALWVAIERLKDPGNLGTILRTCDAVGAGGVILLDESCDPFSVEAVRASMGALFTKGLARATGLEFFDWVRRGPGFIAGASLRAAVDYRQPEYTVPTFLLMGNEQSGLPIAYEDACDVRVKIPMRGAADSLNVAVATALLLYEASNQHHRPLTVSP